MCGYCHVSGNGDLRRSNSDEIVVLVSIERFGKITFAALAVSAGWCCSQTRSHPNRDWLTFRCPDGQTIQARFEPADEFVAVRLSGQDLKLPHVISGSGARYSDGKFTFWNKGKTAMVEVDGRTLVEDCILEPH